MNEQQEQQEQWTHQTAKELRRLADVLDQAESLEAGRFNWGTLRYPTVNIYLADYASVDQLGALLNQKAGVGGYQNKYYGVWVHTDYFEFCITTPAITVPRACPFCDEKHDCTHTDGTVQA